MEKYKSMKEKCMKKVEENLCDSEKGLARYNEGYHEGYSDGWDMALKAVIELAEKHQAGTKPPALEENELKPAIKYLHQPLKALVDKVAEECQEVIDAYNDGETKARIAEELADVQEACETAMSKLGYHEMERRNIRFEVIKKNADRGYYMPDRSKYGN